MSTLISPIGIGGFPFNSSDGDRIYDASDWTDYFSRIIRTGIFRSPTGQLAVTCSQGMTLAVAPGTLYIDGVTATVKETKLLTLSYGDASLPRIDRVIARLDRSARAVRLGILQGVPAAEPTAPELERGTDAHDLCLCEVNVPAGTVALVSSALVDRRADAAVCGWASSLITDLPASVTQGLIYTASQNGGTGAAYTAEVSGISAPPDDGTHITITPTAEAVAGATLSVNGDTARPIYSSEGAPIGAKGLRSGIPAELIYQGGKYFFKLTGGFSRHAAGVLSPARVFTVSDLTFQPKLILLYGEYRGSSTSSYVCAGLFDAGGERILWLPSYNAASTQQIDPSLDTVSVQSNGFTVSFGQLKLSSSLWPTLSTGATVQYHCYA